MVFDLIEKTFQEPGLNNLDPEKGQFLCFWTYVKTEKQLGSLGIVLQSVKQNV